ncbi:MAG TPA: adenine phosphoribosyltransferase [Ignavibacteriaceae bacterium]|nr:adenine phosphoribosyltransferase [Ignavibacteriaceae bacterium]
MSEDLKKYIRSVPDFPKKGIMFRDITTILKEPAAFKVTATQLFEKAQNLDVNKVVGIESRGFIFGSILAERLDVGFVPIRKPNKLPAETVKETYALEYGTDTIEIHKDAIKPGDKILLHDDLLATGGTAEAAVKLIEKLGGRVLQLSFIVELSFLNGRERLKDYDVVSLVNYDSE